MLLLMKTDALQIKALPSILAGTGAVSLSLVYYLMGAIAERSSDFGGRAATGVAYFNMGHLMSPLNCLLACLCLPFIFGSPGRRGKRSWSVLLLLLLFLPHIYTRFRGYSYWMSAPALIRIIMPLSFDWIAMGIFGLFFLRCRLCGACLTLGLCQGAGIGTNYIIRILSQEGHRIYPEPLFFASACLVSLSFLCMLSLVLSSPVPEAPESPPDQAASLHIESSPSSFFLNKRLFFLLFSGFVLSFPFGNILQQAYVISGVHSAVVRIVPLSLLTAAAIPLLDLLADRNLKRFINLFMPLALGMFLVIQFWPLLGVSTFVYTLLYHLATPIWYGLRMALVPLLLGMIRYPRFSQDSESSIGPAFLFYFIAGSNFYTYSFYIHYIFFTRTLGMEVSVMVGFLFAAASSFFLGRYWYLSMGEEGKVDAPLAAGVEEAGQASWEAYFKSKGLSIREQEVMTMILSGRSYREIGEKLGVAPSTVATHTRRAYGKLEVKTAKELSARLLGQRKNETPSA